MKLPRQTYPSLQKAVSGSQLSNAYIDIGNVLNSNLEFGNPTDGLQNLSGFWYMGVVATANVEFAVTHSLKRVPTGFILFSIDQAGIVYRSTTAWTITQAFLKCNTAGANLILFIT